MRKAILITITTLLLLVFTVLSMGGGHGLYWPAKIIYPYSMIIGMIIGQIETFAITLAIVQVPIYGMIISRKPKRVWILLAIHIVAAIACLNIPTENFSG